MSKRQKGEGYGGGVGVEVQLGRLPLSPFWLEEGESSISFLPLTFEIRGYTQRNSISVLGDHDGSGPLSLS